MSRASWSPIAICGAIALICTAESASACSYTPWNEPHEQYMRRISDAVVWGSYVPSDLRGQGEIVVSRRMKGPRLNTIRVRWDIDWTDDGVSCDPWQPDGGYLRGRFFLTENEDGTFSVIRQYPQRKSKD